jgi:two-component sensor histidine kinase
MTYWWLFSVFWLLIALASVLEAWIFRSITLSDAVRSASRQWLPWMLLSPIVLWLSAAFTLERGRWLRNLWIHLAACAAILTSLGAIAYVEGPPPFARGGEPGRLEFGFGDGQRGMRMMGPGDGRRGEAPTSEQPQGEGAGSDAQPGQERRPGSPGSPGESGDRRGQRMDGRGFRQGGPGRGGPHRGPPPMGAMGFMVLRLSTFQLPTYLAMLGAAHALLFYRRASDRERQGAELESRLAHARLDALRMQLNPHFLFNTLNSIASLVYDQPRAADEMIGSLSDLLRLTLNASDRQEVTLREELDFLDHYLRIEQTRFGERLKVERQIDAEALESQVPILILQPLVENAVKHGIEEQLAPGVIAITARREGDLLHLSVSDNGRGPETDADGKLKEGVGLSNTRGRLRELYGEQASMKLGTPKNGGFLVELQIPWRRVTIDTANKPAKG